MRSLIQCKRNHINPTTQCGENVQNVLQNRYFTHRIKCADILAHFGRFLTTRMSVWADSFYIGSGYSRNKFRLPTAHILRIQIFNFILHYTPLEGGYKIFYGSKKILPDGPYMAGNRMRNLLNKFKIWMAKWHTLL